VEPCDSFVDSFTERLDEASGDALRRLRHNPNTGETPWYALRCPETISRESLNPKVQGSIPCASTTSLCKFGCAEPSPSGVRANQRWS
jgi:hypothetical protein